MESILNILINFWRLLILLAFNIGGNTICMHVYVYVYVSYIYIYIYTYLYVLNYNPTIVNAKFELDIFSNPIRFFFLSFFLSNLNLSIKKCNGTQFHS